MTFSEKSSVLSRTAEPTSNVPPRAAQSDLSETSRCGSSQKRESTPARSVFAQASVYEENAERLADQLHRIEESICLARIFLTTSEAIEYILIDSRRMLEKGRTLTEPSPRKALADTFRGVKQQIDDIVDDAEFNGLNLAAGDTLDDIFDEDNAQLFQADTSALSIGALELSGHGNTFESNADFTNEIMRVRNAISMVGTRRAVVEMGLSLLKNRARFTRKKIYSLYGAALSRNGLGKKSGLPGKATRRRGEYRQPTIPTPSPSETATVARNDNMQPELPLEEGIKDKHEEELAPTETPNAKAAPVQMVTLNAGEPDESDTLDCMAKDLACLLGDESFLRNWLKYDTGDTAIFTRLLVESYGRKLIQKYSSIYSSDEKFRDIADRYVFEFESRVETETRSESNRKVAIEEYLRTDQGTLYIMLTRVRKRAL